jgi:uroporphyrin-III C-methyltransferase
VIYMGVSNAASIAARLVEAGRSLSTPALIVENASRPDERRALVTLAELGEAAKSFSGPALLMIGEAMALASERGLPARILEESGLEARAPAVAP